MLKKEDEMTNLGIKSNKDRKRGLNSLSSNLLKYFLDFYTINEFIEISKVCRNLYKVINNMNMYIEYMKLIKTVNTYPKNIVETLFKENAVFLTSKLKFELFLTEEDRIKTIQNFLHFYLREKKNIVLSDNLRVFENGIQCVSTYLTFLQSKVEVLNLNYNVLSEESCEYLKEAFMVNKKLKFVHLNGVNLNLNASKYIAQGLAQNTSIEKLEMSYNNNLSLESISNFFHYFKLNTAITCLAFTDNLLRQEGTKIISEFLKGNQTLKTLYIEKNEIGDEGLVYLSNSLSHNSTLEVLNLSDNGITHVGLKTLTACLSQPKQIYLDLEGKNTKANYSLKKLFLRSNNFNSTEASKHLGDLIANNRNLKYFDLSHNNLSDNLIRPLTEALRINHYLETLILEANSLGALGAYFLSEGIKYNRGIKVLNIRNNSLGFEGAKHISEMLMVNKTLSNLNLQANLLDEHSITLIADKVGYNTELKIINLAFNQLSNIHDMISGNTLAKDVIMY